MLPHLLLVILCVKMHFICIKFLPLLCSITSSLSFKAHEFMSAFTTVEEKYFTINNHRSKYLFSKEMRVGEKRLVTVSLPSSSSSSWLMLWFPCHSHHSSFIHSRLTSEFVHKSTLLVLIHTWCLFCPSAHRVWPGRQFFSSPASPNWCFTLQWQIKLHSLTLPCDFSRIFFSHLTTHLVTGVKCVLICDHFVFNPLKWGESKSI